jgi:hypothetical protein
MNLRRLVFQYDDDPTNPVNGVKIDFLPADPSVNAVFRAALQAHVQPYALSAHLGRLTEPTAIKALAKAYAEGVITGSPCDALMNMTRGDWEQWLIDHPDEFERLREEAEPKEDALSELFSSSSAA